MTDADRPRFAKALAVLSEVFQAPLSDVGVDAYWWVLRTLEWPLFELATREALATCKWFPRPAELLTLAEAPGRQSPEEAWSLLLEQARRVGSYATPQLPPPVESAMRAVFGSWQDFCAAEVRGPEGIGWRKQFASAYGVYAEREAQVDRLPPGVLERAREILAERQRTRLLSPAAKETRHDED